MRFSFLALIVALTTSITFVSACAPVEAPCLHDGDCCDKEDKCVQTVSRGSLLCIKFSLDDSPFGPCNIRRMVLKCAIIKAISPKEEAVKFARSNTLLGHVSAFPLRKCRKVNEVFAHLLVLV
ncbi:hypothetical protein DFJ58DRAFT_191605 [Suillus subalutaceus]|uniref:uncharacterized protein n=1 Tax=Suillus subalutaceus TaxID=48586 RepID=UPI001B87F0CB|nr:uncharacterized protein DFJ58DRAFT_191605 [Suillus subalutaceus]KAG1836033.1 hypothetical protein DFJ58DRAFT_191605 [Suillus subalutaceus]